MIAALEPVMRGVPVTLLLALTAFTIGALLAVPFTAAVRAENRLLRESARLVLDLIRGVPIVVWLFLLYFGVSVGGFRFDALGAAVVGLGVVSAAYLSEVYRGALLGIPRTQLEASDALGFRRFDRFRMVVLPQAFVIALPGATTFGIALLKDTSIAAIIGVTEITFLTQAATRSEQAGLLFYVIAAVTYFLLALPLGLASRSLDARLRKARSTR